jgi:phage anti-repressor protein
MDFKTYAMDALKAQDEKLDGPLVEKFISLIETEEEFPVPLDLLVELEIYGQVSDAKRGLERAGFIDGRDFCAEILKTSGPKGGRPKKDIFISADSFKSLCMLAQNEKGRQTRSYFLTVEQLWKKYMEAEMKTVQEEKEKLKTNLKEEKKCRHKAEQKYKQAYGREHPHKFNKTGPSFYIVSHNGEVKVGKAGVSQQEEKFCDNCQESLRPKAEIATIDKRLVDHRTLWPDLHVDFVVYTWHASLVEKTIKRAYKKKTVKNHEIIRDVPVDKIIQTCTDYLKILDTSNDEPCFYIEPDLDIYNVKEPVISPDVIVLDRGTIKINHIEAPKAEVQNMLPKLSSMKLNQLKQISRRFKLPIFRTRDELIGSIETAINTNLKEPTEEEFVEEKIPNYDINKLPEGLTVIYNDDHTVHGIRMRAFLGGQTYETTFNDVSYSLEERYEEAWTLRQDVIREYKATGTVNWESYSRKKPPRLGICMGCGTKVGITSSFCLSCSAKSGIKQPERHILLAMIREHRGNLSAVGRELKKSDTAIRKWLIQYGINSQQIKDKTYY